MPGMVANYLIGVQPMTAAAGQVFSLSSRYGYQSKVRLNKAHYRHFLRINNRRQYHTTEYLDTLNYPSVKLTRRNDSPNNAMDARIWAVEHLKEGTYINSGGQFWFANERDYTLFSLKWST